MNLFTAPKPVTCLQICDKKVNNCVLMTEIHSSNHPIAKKIRTSITNKIISNTRNNHTFEELLCDLERNRYYIVECSTVLLILFYTHGYDPNTLYLDVLNTKETKSGGIVLCNCDTGEQSFPKQWLLFDGKKYIIDVFLQNYKFVCAKPHDEDLNKEELTFFNTFLQSFHTIKLETHNCKTFKDLCLILLKMNEEENKVFTSVTNFLNENLAYKIRDLLFEKEKTEISLKLIEIIDKMSGTNGNLTSIIFIQPHYWTILDGNKTQMFLLGKQNIIKLMNQLSLDRSRVLQEIGGIVGKDVFNDLMTHGKIQLEHIKNIITTFVHKKMIDFVNVVIIASDAHLDRDAHKVKGYCIAQCEESVTEFYDQKIGIFSYENKELKFVGTLEGCGYHEKFENNRLLIA